ncbi:MAG: OmpA family protein [Betaproteobacteria bacterium]|nr:MAG: OmpA family protein [Betaproteobacteria bacterium]
MIDRLRRSRAGVALIMVCTLLGACATGTVVLLPEKDGRHTAVTVKQGDREILLEEPYAATRVTPVGPRAYRSSAQEVESQFGPALAARPSRAASFTLYFVEGKDEFTEESRLVVDRILSEIALRPVPDVLVVGHTDLVGSDPFNDALGQQRAETVRSALIRLGIPQSDIHAISRGKRAPAVPTADGVAEPRNRRVEIIVR